MIAKKTFSSRVTVVGDMQLDIVLHMVFGFDQIDHRFWVIVSF